MRGNPASGNVARTVRCEDAWKDRSPFRQSLGATYAGLNPVADLLALVEVSVVTAAQQSSTLGNPSKRLERLPKYLAAGAFASSLMDFHERSDVSS